MTVEASPARSTSPLLSLQVLRAVAALAVLLHHAGYDADTLAAHRGAAPFGLDRFVDLGFGIHLFFVISGFIMLRTARGYGSVRGALVFLARRIVRVVPLYWLMSSLVLVGTAIAPGLLNSEPGGPGWVLGSYLFLPVARESGAINPVLGQGWTLDYEMFFYLLFGLTMLLPRRTALPVLAAALIGLVALGHAVTPPFAAAAVWTDGLLLEFLFGLGLAVAAERGWRLGPAGAATAVLAGALGIVALGPLSGHFDGLAPWFRGGVPSALIVGGCVLGPRWSAGRGVIALAVVGDASYSLYLSHPFAVRLLAAAWTAAVPPGATLWSYLVVACVAAIITALLLHRFVERPMTEALQRRSLAGAVARPILPEAAAVAETARRSR
jgi:peptidoglycan/LPS O-acetylase OafA/YrhL